MGRTLITYRLRLQKNKQDFLRIMKLIGMGRDGFDRAWSYAEQSAMSGSVFPHAKTGVISALSMLPGLYGSLEVLSDRVPVVRENTFGSVARSVDLVVSPWGGDFIDPWLLMSSSSVFGGGGGKRGMLRELLMTWFIPFLSPSAQGVMLKVLERPEFRVLLDDVWDYPGDALVFFLHVALYDLFSRVHRLEDAVALLNETRESLEKGVEGKVKRGSGEEKKGKGGVVLGKHRVLSSSYRYYRQTRLELEVSD